VAAIGRIGIWRVQTRGAAAMAAGEPYVVWQRGRGYITVHAVSILTANAG
jgi:hypothetical protein